jgi:hypothetical protein
MLYYPKSQIKTNLYTNGEEYIVEQTKLPYTGFYYMVSTGETFIGSTPNEEDNQIKIIKISNDLQGSNDKSPSKWGTEISNESSPQGNFLKLQYPKNIDFQPRSLPVEYLTSPSTTEITQGEYKRYFAKKNNELIYLEISKNDYNKYSSSDPTVASDLYSALPIIWSINNSAANLGVVTLVERNNKWYGFTSYFRGNFG